MFFPLTLQEQCYGKWKWYAKWNWEMEMEMYEMLLEMEWKNKINEM